MDDRKITISGILYRTFSTVDGKAALAWILEQCGYNERNPARIKPELLAFANMLLYYGNFGLMGHSDRFTQALIDSHDAEKDFTNGPLDQYGAAN